MGYTKPTTITEVDLCNADLPLHGKTYTVIPHRTIIAHTENLLRENNFIIKKKTFKSNANARVAQGIYQIVSTHDDDMGMMFAWTNSYDKSTRFQCGIGGYVFVCNNGMIHGDMATFARKHTGLADIEVQRQISSQVKYAHKHFNQLVQDKDQFKNKNLSKKEQSELVGRLFIDEEIIDATQVSTIKREMNKPSFNYNSNVDSAWSFYNHVTHALKLSHPRSWMTNQQKFHKFMTTELLSQLALKGVDYDIDKIRAHYKAKPLDNAYQGVSEMMADLEAQDFDTFGDFKI
jgi:hypothetical protein